MHNGLTPVELAGRLGLAIAMAVFMGLAFEGVYKREVQGTPGGIRTFPTLTTLGLVLFSLQPSSLLPFTVGLAAVGAWLYAHIRSVAATNGYCSLIIPILNLLAYSFGAIALTQPPYVVVAAAVTAVLFLEGREPLHQLVKNTAPGEIYTLGKFLILVGIVLPLLPDHPIVSWTPITPFQVWLALVAVSSISYASYLLQRYLPPRGTQVLLPAILGGIYSSTATTIALARQQRQAGGNHAAATGGIVMATAIMYPRLLAMVAFFNWKLAESLLPPMGGLFVVGAAIAIWEWLRAPVSAAASSPLPISNPLQLATSISFAAMFVLISIASGWVRSAFGQAGILILAAISGIADANPLVMSLAQGGAPGVPARTLSAAVLIAASSNNLLKALYAVAFGRKVCGRAAAELCLLGIAGLALTLLFLR
ncbi:MAG TPA: DUF4010 domain-containing protein [Steroidobacteraceae bacterium]